MALRRIRKIFAMGARAINELSPRYLILFQPKKRHLAALKDEFLNSLLSNHIFSSRCVSAAFPNSPTPFSKRFARRHLVDRKQLLRLASVSAVTRPKLACLPTSTAAVFAFEFPDVIRKPPVKLECFLCAGVAALVGKNTY